MEYDAAGRLLARHTETAVTSYAYDALDRLLSASRIPTDAGKALGIESDTVRFEYDAAGQLVAEHGAGHVHQIRWNVIPPGMVPATPIGK